ncbi:MAG: putative sulfate exporter family transporter [Bacteriovoracaceae bacterium]|nr:putative sulfate exporter family transporter [Bacteriovoracaceae bacterium]
MNFLSPQWFLLTGIILSFFWSKNDIVQKRAKLWGTKLLQLSVILLGASLNFNSVLKQGAEGVLITFISIVFVFFLGFLGRKLFNIEDTLGLLITMGTAICGGSAIAALAPVIAADSMIITVSISIVFFLNAMAVFLFPILGDFFGLTQEQFGLLSALAIHDTSSVVAASAIYGNKALEVATTVKLTRALWIIPITLFFSFYKNRLNKKNLYLPWFILGFLVLSLVFTFIDFLHPLKGPLLFTSKLGFSLTLFLIGVTFNFEKLRKIGPKPFFFGFLLWVLVIVASMILITW